MNAKAHFDLHHGLAHPAVEQTPNGALRLTFTQDQDWIALTLSLPSLEALWLTLTLALARIKRC